MPPDDRGCIRGDIPISGSVETEQIVATALVRPTRSYPFGRTPIPAETALRTAPQGLGTRCGDLLGIEGLVRTFALSFMRTGAPVCAIGPARWLSPMAWPDDLTTDLRIGDQKESGHDDRIERVHSNT